MMGRRSCCRRRCILILRRCRMWIRRLRLRGDRRLLERTHDGSRVIVSCLSQHPSGMSSICFVDMMQLPDIVPQRLQHPPHPIQHDLPRPLPRRPSHPSPHHRGATRRPRSPIPSRLLHPDAVRSVRLRTPVPSQTTTRAYRYRAGGR